VCARARVCVCGCVWVCLSVCVYMHMHMHHLSVLHPEVIRLSVPRRLPADNKELVVRRNASEDGVLLQIFLLLRPYQRLPLRLFEARTEGAVVALQSRTCPRGWGARFRKFYTTSLPLSYVSILLLTCGVLLFGPAGEVRVLEVLLSSSFTLSYVSILFLTCGVFAHT
jgi:hypothetical protein